jgi:hypothetical protein
MKYVIVLNLLLTLFFAYMANLLYQEIESMKVAKNTDPVYVFAEFTRKPVALPAKWRDIFGTPPPPVVVVAAAPPAPPIVDEDSSKPFQGKIRLRGIFIFNDIRKAVISIGSVKGQENPKEQKKLITCKTGDTIEGFAITRILPDRIVLTSRSLEPMTIMVYKPLTINGK